jgi:hypothetical protein
VGSDWLARSTGRLLERLFHDRKAKCRPVVYPMALPSLAKSKRSHVRARAGCDGCDGSADPVRILLTS